MSLPIDDHGFEALCRWRGLQPESDRPIVDQADFHIRPEYTAGAIFRFPPGSLHQVIKQALSFFRRRCRCETRPVATVGISRQRELGHQQQSAFALLQIQIHPACIVRKHAVSQYALQKPVRLLPAIITLHTNQGQNPFFNPAFHFSVNMN